MRTSGGSRSIVKSRASPAPAVAGSSVCRFHGAGGGQPPGPDHPSRRHGRYSLQTIEQKRMIQTLIRSSEKLLAKSQSSQWD